MGYFEISFANESQRRPLPKNDFRRFGQQFFRSLVLMCFFAQNTYIGSTDMQSTESYVNDLALARKCSATA